MDRPWEAFDRARRVLQGRDDLAGGKSAGLPSVGGSSSRVWVRIDRLLAILLSCLS